MLTKLVKNIDRQLAVGSSRLESSTQLARLSWPPRIAFCAACPLASNLRLFWVAYSHALLEVVHRSLSSESPRRSIAADPLDSVAPDPRSIAADPQDSVALDPLVSVAATGSYKATQNQRSRLISLNLRINRTRACTYALNLFRMSLVSQQQYAQRL